MMNAYELGSSPSVAPPAWHVVRRGDTLGLCGKLLLPDAEVRPITSADSVPEPDRCRDCWTAYLDTLDAV